MRNTLIIVSLLFLLLAGYANAKSTELKTLTLEELQATVAEKKNEEVPTPEVLTLTKLEAKEVAEANGYKEKEIVGTTQVIDIGELIANVQKPLLERLDKVEKTQDSIVKRIADTEDKVSFHHPETEVSGIGNIGTGKTALDKSAKDLLRLLAAKVKKGEVQIVQINGHADMTKPKNANTSNDAISLERAMAAVEFLKAEGVNTSAIKVIGAGSTERYGEKLKNRRITIIAKKVK
jgi:outer membrane protein OmpA-like peptidoglycan-associated protein